jgi:hypothetical protein
MVRGVELPLILYQVRQADNALYARFMDIQGSEIGLELVFRLNKAALQVYLVPEGAAFPEVRLFSRGLEAPADWDGALPLIRNGRSSLPPSSARICAWAQNEGPHMAMAGLIKLARF